MTTTPVQPKKKMSLGKKVLIGFGVLFLIGLIGSQLDAKEGPKDKDKTGPATEKDAALTQAQKDSISKAEKAKELEEIKKSTFTAKQLMDEYEANEVSADNNFKGKTFYVSGKIKDIKKDVLNHIYVTLDAGGLVRQVQCYVEDAETASKLTKGLQVTFKGTCDGLMINVLMKDCVLVSQ